MSHKHEVGGSSPPGATKIYDRAGGRKNAASNESRKALGARTPRCLLRFFMGAILLNYYERHIGDYAKDAGHLSMLEHGAYTLLLDRYYATEVGIPADQAYKLARARSAAEKAAVDAVLTEFFTLRDGAWIKGRVQEEIQNAQTRIEAARINGKKGGRPKSNQTGTHREPNGLGLGTPDLTQQKAHQTPDTRHQTPILKTEAKTHALHTEARASPAEACKAMRNAGISTTNPAHPVLRELCASGATVQEFSEAAQIALSKGKAFAYAIGVVEGRRADAEKVSKTPMGTPQPSRDAQRSATLAGLTGGLMGNGKHPETPERIIDAERID